MVYVGKIMKLHKIDLTKEHSGTLSRRWCLQMQGLVTSGSCL